jgi:hypothetical protein
MQHPMNHLQFKVAFCKALLHGWQQRTNVLHEALTEWPSIHMPSHTTLKRACIVYAIRTPHTYYY